MSPSTVLLITQSLRLMALKARRLRTGTPAAQILKLFLRESYRNVTRESERDDSRDAQTRELHEAGRRWKLNLRRLLLMDLALPFSEMRTTLAASRRIGSNPCQTPEAIHTSRLHLTPHATRTTNRITHRHVQLLYIVSECAVSPTNTSGVKGRWKNDPLRQVLNYILDLILF